MIVKESNPYTCLISVEIGHVYRKKKHFTVDRYFSEFACHFDRRKRD